MAQKPGTGGYAITPELLWRIHAAMERKGKSWRDLSIARRTWQGWHSSEADRRRASGRPLVIRPKMLQWVARSLEMSVDELLTSPVLSFDGISEVAGRVDAYLMSVLSAIRDVPAQLAYVVYDDLLSARLTDYGFTVRALLGLLNDVRSLDAIIESMPPAELRIAVADRLQTISFEVDGEDRLIVVKPQLLWDCRCRGGADARLRRHCAIHSHPSSHAITSAFNNAHVAIQWRGVVTRWRNRDPLWPPSRDSFEFVRSLEKHASNAISRCRTVVDLGSGTGFLGIMLGSLGGEVRRLELSDWLLTPALYSAVNARRNLSGRPAIKCHVRLGMHDHWRDEETRTIHDVLVCNPPYLPALPGVREIGSHAAVAGTDLLEHVIAHGHTLARDVFIQFSELAFPEAHSAATRSGKSLQALGNWTRVPFRVRDALQNAEYMHALAKRQSLIPGGREEHAYFHRIRSFAVDRPSTTRGPSSISKRSMPRG